MEEGETKYCNNCKRDIAAVNFVMHEVHCRRNIILCEKCKEPVPRSELDSHNEEEHAFTPCNMCNVDFEKRDIDSHKEECPKRPSQCPYCEIDCPRDELDGHMEYCGTRTEQCPICNQYIMQKDLVKHEESNCTYPEPKTNPVVADTSNDAGDPRFGFRDLTSSFVRGEMERFMLPPGAQRGFRYDRENPSTEYSRKPIPRHADRGDQHVPLTSHLQERARRENQKRIPDNEISREEVTRNKLKSRPVVKKTTPSKTAKSNEMDGLLAMQLANDLSLNPEEIDDHMIAEDMAARETVETRAQVAEPEVRRRKDSLDEVMIPCEHCGEQLPLDSLLQHQGNCSEVHASQSVESGSAHTDPLNQGHYPLNNASGASSSSSGSGQNHLDMINNLALPVESVWSTSRFPEDNLNVAFPCEFCSETFPEDMLIQHQSICDMNPYKTPRVMTPKVTNSQRAMLNQRNAASIGAPSNYGYNRNKNQTQSPNFHNSTPSRARPNHGTKTPEVRKQETVRKTNRVLDDFMHNPSYTPVNLPKSHRDGSYNSNGSAESKPTFGINGTRRPPPRHTSKPKPVKSTSYEPSGLDGRGAVMRTNNATQKSRTKGSRPRRPQSDD